MKTDELKAWGLTDEQSEKVMAQYGKDVSKLQKENEKLTADRDKEKERADTAEETLKKFDGVDVETMQAELATWQQKAKDAEKEYEEKIRERDIKDKVNEKLSGVKMKEDMKDFIYEEILKTGVSLNKNGELIGFDEGLKSVQEKRPSAFVDEKQEQLESGRAKPFTGPLKGAAQPTNSEKFKAMSLDERMKLKASDPAAYESMRKGE